MVAVMLVVAMLALIGMISFMGEVQSPVGSNEELIQDALDSRGQTIGFGLVSYHALAQRFYFSETQRTGTTPTDLIIDPNDLVGFTYTRADGSNTTYSINDAPYMSGTRDNNGLLTSRAEIPYQSYVDSNGVLFSYVNLGRINAQGEVLSSNGSNTGVQMMSVRAGTFKLGGQSLSMGRIDNGTFIPSFSFVTVVGFGGANCENNNNSGRCRVNDPGNTQFNMAGGGNAPNTGQFTSAMPVIASRMR
ncbi:MAG: hypothetical protein Alpg2KO_18570 [Alphaproteobacteria bacterium]